LPHSELASPIHAKGILAMKKKSADIIPGEDMAKRIKETQNRKIFEIGDIKKHLEELSEDGMFNLFYPFRE